jgi:drug/metabolite transporter (DMT)-like permease
VTGFVLLLLISSTFMHAGWNLLMRHRRSEAAQFMFRMYVVIVAAGLVPMAAAGFLSEPLPAKVWLCAAVSGVFSAVYSLALAKGYASADFTVVYPVARALPVLMVAAGDALLGRTPTAVGWLGMATVTTGCFLAPMESFREFHPRAYFHRSIFWMVLTALGTVGYTLVDKAAAGFVTAGPASAARYGYLYFASTAVFYTILWRLFEKRRAGVGAPRWGVAALAALMTFGAYWLVLWAYQLVERASYVVAFRQFSIVIGVILAFIIYKEKGRAVRVTAALLIALGLVIIALWGGTGGGR